MYLLLHPEERVRLIGSCDALGDPVSNERLAWERAFAVQAFLMAHGTLISQIDVEIALPKYSEKNERDRKVDIAFQ
jgi:outer membrane protein OmpA-like peptidoglycan-associated protein